MRPMSWKQLCIIGMTIVFGAACSKDEPASLTSPPRGVVISLRVSPVRVRIGQSAEIVLEVTNRGPDRVELEFDCRDHIGYRIEDADGSMVYRFPGLCEIVPHTLNMDPGWTESLRRNLPSTLAPARYVVKAGILDHEAEYPWATASLVVHW
jgi:hypothetical protein